MDAFVAAWASPEVAPAWLQLLATLGLVALCVGLYRRYRRRYFLLWSAGWMCQAAAVVSLLFIVAAEARGALFWEQVFTAWGAVTLAWAAIVFAGNRPRREWVLLTAFVPVVWAFSSVYVLGNALWARVPMPLFVAVMLALGAGSLLRYDRVVRSPAGRYLAIVLLLWAVIQGSEAAPASLRLAEPWSTNLVTALVVAVGLGILLLVLEDLAQGLDTLTALSGELQGGMGGEEQRVEAMLRRALSFRGVHGSALWLSAGAGGAFIQGTGVSALWPFEPPPAAALSAVGRVLEDGSPHVVRGQSGARSRAGAYPYTAALPVVGEDGLLGSVVVTGEARDPFTVLDDRFLLAFGQQVGAALANEELHEDLTARTKELERLQARLVHQHEEERNRIWRELHDETAQLLAALNLQLGVIAERSSAEMGPALERAGTLLGDGMKSIRRVTRDLRPLPLDDLGLVPALRALARDFDNADLVDVNFAASEPAPRLEAAAESALYRAMQEGLANAVRHGSARRIDIEVTAVGDRANLLVRDDGRGLSEDVLDRMRSSGGLAGIRERVATVGGDFSVGNAPGGGAELRVSVPLASDEDSER